MKISKSNLKIQWLYKTEQLDLFAGEKVAHKICFDYTNNV